MDSWLKASWLNMVKYIIQIKLDILDFLVPREGNKEII